MNILDRARRVFEIEARAIMDLGSKLTSDFEKAVDLIYQCKDRVVLTGMGKAGIVGRKIAATLASTGTPAFFMHPAEGMHGDLGMVTPDNVVLAISHNGNTEEILRLIPYIKHFKIKLIGMTGNLKSELARQSDVVLDISVKEEACPLGLTPTASTTAALTDSSCIRLFVIPKVSALKAMLNKMAIIPRIAWALRLYQPETRSIASLNHFSRFSRNLLSSDPASFMNKRSVSLSLSF